MLRSLDIRDILIIDRLELNFQPGLNVLTGETGAGKSILLDALGFVLGWRGRAGLVRAGAEQGEVSAAFDLSADHPARVTLKAAGLPVEDELILRRTNGRDGRKTAWVNDRRVSGEVLRKLSDSLVELHGQRDDGGLLNRRGHQKLLDEFGGLAPQLVATLTAWRALSDARAAQTEAEVRLAALREEDSYLRHAVSELDALAPLPGEEASLDARRRLMQSAASISDDIAKAHVALGLQGAEGMIGDAQRWLEAAAQHAAEHLEDAISSLGRAFEELGEAQQRVEASLEALSFNATDLEDTEERLFAIRALARKHGVGADDLAEFGEGLRAKLVRLDSSSAEQGALAEAVAQAQSAYDQAAETLRKRREKSAARLDSAMAAELAPLKLERAVFTTEIVACDAGPTGRDLVTFTIATNPGAAAGPLNKIASGGELSRFLLALKVCLTADAAGLTLIFDEIDRGVGGATANAVGKRLAELATGSQVLVVTHSPQVAALGHHHWRVEKQVTNGATTSSVLALDADARVDEIARMLSGDRISEAARAAARALLSGDVSG